MPRDAESGIVVSHSPARHRRRAAYEPAAVACVALAALSASCSAIDGLDDLGPSIGTHTEALPTGAWDNWHSEMAVGFHVGDPTLCSNHIGYFVTIHLGNRRYNVKRWGRNENPNWKEFGTREFGSPPSCAMEYPSNGNDTRFVLAGRAFSDNRIYAIEGIEPPQPPGDAYPPNPDWLGPWTQVSSDEFTGSTNGFPAVASDGTNRVVLTYLNSNRVYARYRNLPYGTNGWTPASGTAAITAPVFPSGVTASGVPAITYMSGSTNKFVVMVRGVKSGASALYWIYFTTSFQGSWAKVSPPFTASSAPALDYDTTYGALTAYFRSGNQVVQGSAPSPGQLGSFGFHPITNGTSTVITGTPRVSFNAGIEGNRAAIILGYDADVPPMQTSFAFLLTETGDEPSPW
jgi:hypothetical protein